LLRQPTHLVAPVVRQDVGNGFRALGLLVVALGLLVLVGADRTSPVHTLLSNGRAHAASPARRPRASRASPGPTGRSSGSAAHAGISATRVSPLRFSPIDRKLGGILSPGEPCGA